LHAVSLQRDALTNREPIQRGRSEKKESMAVKIRLKRTGMKKAPSYRVVVADARSPRDGRIIENIGWYNPRVEPSEIHIDEEKAIGWLKNGAQPTESVTSLLKRAGIMDHFKQMKLDASAQPTEAPADAK
jgi:small subunit ribosomal protein S16